MAHVPVTVNIEKFYSQKIYTFWKNHSLLIKIRIYFHETKTHIFSKKQEEEKVSLSLRPKLKIDFTLQKK